MHSNNKKAETMETNNFKEAIKPFFWVEHSNSFSVCLDVGAYKQEIFDIRADEGFEGNGYDWASLADVLLKKKELIWLISFILILKQECFVLTLPIQKS